MEIFDRREFLKRLSAAGIYLSLTGNSLFLHGCDNNGQKKEIAKEVTFSGDPRFKRVILIGMDGLDPKILSLLMQSGALPNFSRLGMLGSYSPLSTSISPQSPVAWATIATGRNPGYHGVFDFINRNLPEYTPDLAILKFNPQNLLGRRESMFLPVMQGNAFWDYTSSQSIASTIIRWPVTFPPRRNETKLYAGLGVPDLKGNLGKYTFYTSRHIPDDEDGVEKAVRITLRGNAISTFISGPRVSKSKDKDEAKAALAIRIAPDNESIEIETENSRISAKKGEWSNWLEVTFNVGLMKTVSGIVKFYLNRIKPDFELYMTAVQINPKDPAFVISNPDHYIRELADNLGYFYTLGIPEDTKALTEGKMSEDAFANMCNEIIDEQEKMLWYELEQFKEGLFSFVFFSTDRIQHMFWATRDPGHPLYNKTLVKQYGHVIDDVYVRMDKILGEILDYVDNTTAIIVFSDHGFASFRRSVHLNSWLVENGFMTLKRNADKGDTNSGALFRDVDWENTAAYALGLGNIYLNLKGREKHGIVERGAGADSVLNKISRKLRLFKDPVDGKPVVKSVYAGSALYAGGEVERSPDLVVGFQEGYRASWQTAIGGSPGLVLENNLKKWSGDHIMDPSIVPGIILTNFKIKQNEPGVMDIAPTVLAGFGMKVPRIEGRSLL